MPIPEQKPWTPLDIIDDQLDRISTAIDRLQHLKARLHPHERQICNNLNTAITLLEAAKIILDQTQNQ